MIGWPWWNPALALVSAVVGGYFAVRGAADRGPERAACWTHALMAVAMAAMLWPGADLVPARVGAVVFAVLGAWFLAARLRRGPGAAGGPTHAAVGCAAMVVMYLSMSTATSTATPGTGTTGHAGHAGAGSGAAGLLTVALGLALTGYFAWHAWAAGTAPGTASRAPTGPARTTTRRRARMGTVAHVALDAVMAVAFLGTL